MSVRKKYELGFIGLGHMGLAIARGAVISGHVDRFQIAVYDPAENMKTVCKQEGFALLSSEKELAESCHITLLAVTPQIADKVLENLKGADIDCIMSIITGVTIEHIQNILGSDVPVIRGMPNTPLQINKGATALCRSKNTLADDYDFVYGMFDSMGVTQSVPEDRMTEAVILNGSTPAYFFYMAECMVKDAVDRGISEESARALIVQTMIGSGELMSQKKRTPISELVDEVCSKGGTTIEAISSMKEDNLEKIIKKANDACIKRAEELGAK